METLEGRVAVVTGGASGIGLALARAFLAEGMKVVVADVEAGALADACGRLSAAGEILGVVTDVTDPASVDRLAAATFDQFGACHVLCNNAGVGAPSSTVWETTVNDWRWVHGVNVMGVVHGIQAFVPRMIAAGEPGYVVNTSSGDGGIAPMPSASVYAASKAAVTSLTECLAMQFLSEGTNLRAGIFYPSGGLLRTGLWTADRNRPAELARERPRATEAMTIEKLEAMAKQGGHELKFQDLDELAQVVVDGVRAERFIMMIGVESIGVTMRERAAAFEQGELPEQHAGVFGLMDRYVVISADGHAGPPASVYREYLDPGFRDRFDEHQRMMTELRAAMGNNDSTFREEWEAETDGDGGLTAAFDSDARNAILDTEGVVAEVLFPDADVLGTGRIAASPFGTGLAGAADNADEAIAGSRAHNRWLADFVRAEPERRIGVAVIPAIIPDMDTVLALVREAKELGHRGILIPTRWFDRPAYHDPWYEPLWTLTEELGLVLHTHSGAGPSDIGLGPGMLPIYASEAGWWAARPLAVLIWGGIFERHPNLKYSMAENAAWWVPDQIRKMDEKWIGGHNTRKFGNAFREGLSMKPSDYLNRNCFFGASTPGEDDIERRYLIGIGNIMWGNDLPHPEGTFPYTRYWIRERFKNVPEAETRRILGLTAAAVYGVDIHALRPLVERIGPTLDEVHGDAPLPRVPAGV